MAGLTAVHFALDCKGHDVFKAFRQNFQDVAIQVFPMLLNSLPDSLHGPALTGA